MIRVRPAIAAIPAYVPGKSAESVANEHRLARAIKLASNEVPYPPTEKVRAAIAEAATNAHRYPDDNSGALRAALAAKHGLREEQVLVAGGSVTMVGQFVLATCDAGDEVLYSWPSFEAYPILTMHAGAAARTAALRDETYDLDAMADLVGDRTRCIFVCSPNNPTSTAVTREAVERLLARVPSDCLVVVDEAYREFVTDPDRVDGVALLRDHENVVVLRTFSKAYSLAGLRVGYAFGHPDVIAALRKVRPPFPVSGVAQAAALAALDDTAENAPAGRRGGRGARPGHHDAARRRVHGARLAGELRLAPGARRRGGAGRLLRGAGCCPARVRGRRRAGDDRDPRREHADARSAGTGRRRRCRTACRSVGTAPGGVARGVLHGRVLCVRSGGRPAARRDHRRQPRADGRAQSPTHEALVSRHQGLRYTYAELDAPSTSSRAGSWPSASSPVTGSASGARTTPSGCSCSTRRRRSA